MLPRERRIPRKLWNTIIEAPREQSKFHASEHFSLRSVPSPEGAPRIAVSVSKKVSKKAVIRNRTRRRAYSVCSALFPSLKASLYLLSAKPGAEKLKGEVLETEVRQLFSAFLIK